MSCSIAEPQQSIHDRVERMSRFRKAPELKKSSEEWSDQLPSLRSMEPSVEQPTNEARHWPRSCCSLSIPTNCNAMILSWRCWNSASLVSTALSTLEFMLLIVNSLPWFPAPLPNLRWRPPLLLLLVQQCAYRWRRRTRHLVYSTYA